MEGRRSRNVGSSETTMGEDYDQEGEGMGFEGDEDEEDEEYELDEDDDDDVDEDMGQGSSSDAQGRRFRSKAWREFVPVHVDGEVTKGECKHCTTVISAKRGHGTSGLRNHLNRCKDRAAAIGALNQVNATLMTPDGVSCLWKWDPDAARKALVRMVVLHELPLSIVEYPILASMARDCLAVPASTVPSESAFSTGRRVISDFRSRLTPVTAEALICLHDWFRTSNATKLSTASVYDILGEEGLSIQPDTE